MRLLPLRRGAAAGFPIVSRGKWATKRIRDFRRCETVEVVIQTHAVNLPAEKKIGNAEISACPLSAMPNKLPP